MTALLRLAGLPAGVLDTTGHVWQVLRDEPAAAGAITDAAAGVLADVEQRLAAGQRWEDKRLRQRADYLWRLLGRAAFKPVPRGWLGLVAVVPVCDSDATTLLAGDLTARGHAAHQVENVCRVRGDGAVLGLTGLHRFDGSDLSFHAGERHVRLRITPAVRAVCDALRDGTAHADVVREALYEVAGSAADGFLAQLEEIGLVERSRRPASRLVVNAEPGTGHAHGFTDVYRTVRAVVPTTAVSRVRHATTTLARVAGLLLDDALPRPDPVTSLVTEEPRALPEVVDALSSQDFPPRSRGLRWRPAATPASSYATLLAHLERRAGDQVVDIGTALLDELGARPSTWDWPVDVLLRPLPAATPLGVLEAVTPAGALDARFADGLTTLLGTEPAHVTEYRRFLLAAAASAGAEPVEVLIPALSEPGANSVRRPRYTGRWTGDPSPAAYWPDRQDGTGYLPLRDITIRRANGRVVTESGGREVWLLHHATRAPHGAWRHLAGLLRHAFPRRPLPAMELGGLLGAFPHRDQAPRVTVDGELVVSCAQWRWHDRDIPALRDRGAPRWVFARAADGGKPLPVDLDGPTAGRVLSRLGPGQLLVEEMLPGPDALVVHDDRGGLCAQLQLRMYP